jgi:hypothetical protein
MSRIRGIAIFDKRERAFATCIVDSNRLRVLVDND